MTQNNKVDRVKQKKGRQKAKIRETKALISRKRCRMAKLRINGLTMETIGRKLNADKSEVSKACAEILNTPKGVKIRRYIDQLPLQSQMA